MRIAGGLDYCIRRNEPSQLRIIVPRPEVDESGLVVGLFAGEVVPGHLFAAAVFLVAAFEAEGFVLDEFLLEPGGVGEDVCK